MSQDLRKRMQAYLGYMGFSSAEFCRLYGIPVGQFKDFLGGSETDYIWKYQLYEIIEFGEHQVGSILKTSQYNKMQEIFLDAKQRGIYLVVGENGIGKSYVAKSLVRQESQAGRDIVYRYMVDTANTKSRFLRELSHALDKGYDGTRDANYMQQQIITLCRGKHRTIVLDEMQSSRIPPRILETIRTIYDLGNVSFILMWTGSLRDIDMLPQFNSRVLSVYSIPGVCAKDVKLYADKYGWDITREESVRVAEVISEEEGGGGFRELDDARFKFAVWIRQKRMREGAHITYKYIRQAIEEKRIGKEKLAEGVEGGDGSAEKNAA